MSLRLLGCYGSDAEYSDDEDDAPSISEPTMVATGGEQDASEGDLATSEKEKVSNPFFANDNDPSSSDDDSKQPPKAQQGNLQASQPQANSDEPPVKKRLPSAHSILKSKHIGSSVFVSDMQREQNDHNAKLSLHVPLTEQVKATGKSKQICKAFRRGECRRGDKCKYTHPKAASPTQVAECSMKGGAEMYTAKVEVYQKKAKPSKF